MVGQQLCGSFGNAYNHQRLRREHVAGDYGAIQTETRSVARTIPRALSVVEFDRTAAMRALRGNSVQPPGRISVRGDLLAVKLHHSSRFRRNTRPW